MIYTRVLGVFTMYAGKWRKRVVRYFDVHFCEKMHKNLVQFTKLHIKHMSMSDILVKKN